MDELAHACYDAGRRLAGGARHRVEQSEILFDDFDVSLTYASPVLLDDCIKKRFFVLEARKQELLKLSQLLPLVLRDWKHQVDGEEDYSLLKDPVDDLKKNSYAVKLDVILIKFVNCLQ